MMYMHWSKQKHDSFDINLFYSYNSIQGSLLYTFAVPGWHTTSSILTIMCMYKCINLERQSGVLVENEAE